MTLFNTLVVCLLAVTAPQSATETIKPGSTIRIDKQELTVKADGSVDVPGIGALPVAGETAASLQERMGRLFQELGLVRDTPVTVTIVGAAAPAKAVANAYVNGRVKTPGPIEWEEGMTVARALARAGGLLPDAAPNRVQVRRRDASGKYSDVKMPSDRMAIPIQPEDIVEVPRRRLANSLIR